MDKASIITLSICGGLLIWFILFMIWIEYDANKRREMIESEDWESLNKILMKRNKIYFKKIKGVSHDKN